MAFVDMHIFSRDFLHFDMSLLLLTFTLWGVSNKHCLLSLFSFSLIFANLVPREFKVLANIENTCFLDG